MPAADDLIEAEAIRWCLRAPAMDADDWLALTDWLEADPRHAIAYDHARQSELDGDLIVMTHAEEAEPVAYGPEAASVAERRRRLPFWQMGTAAAAALIAAIGGTALLHRPPAAGQTIYATAAGQSRTFTLPDGSRVHLNGASRLAIDGGSDRRARLLDGEAFLEVVHRADRPFELTVGETTLRDIGTAFNVIRREDGFDVAVREGAVAIDPAGTNQILSAGKTAHLTRQTGALILAAVVPETVGSWQNGSLNFNDARLAEVAADVGRSIGKHIGVDPDLAGRRFSGTIKLSHDDHVMSVRLGGLLGVDTIVRSDGWQLRSAARAIH